MASKIVTAIEILDQKCEATAEAAAAAVKAEIAAYADKKGATDTVKAKVTEIKQGGN